MHGLTIRRLCNAIGTLVTLGSLAACGRSDKTRVSDSAAVPGAARRALASPGLRRAYPGALTKAIDDYTGDELFELTRRLRFGGSHERERACRGMAGCDGTAPTHRTLVQVSAVATQDSLSAADVPPFGVIYVRAINRGDATEARYGLRPGNTLRYYMIVQRDSSGAMGWRLEELVTTPPRRHARVASGAFTGCGHELQWTPGARADFKTCEAAERSDTVVTLGLAAQLSDPPLWSSCGSGCCVF